HRLSRLWHQPAAFVIEASLHTRDRQRVELQNSWRKKQGLAALPVPAPRPIERARDSTIGPLLQALRTATTAGERQAARRAIEALGLAALPAVKDALATAKAGDPAAAELRTLMTRLAAVVTDLEVADSPAAL